MSKKVVSRRHLATSDNSTVIDMTFRPVVIVQKRTGRLPNNRKRHPKDHVAQSRSRSAPLLQWCSHGNQGELEKHARERIAQNHVCWEPDQHLVQDSRNGKDNNRGRDRVPTLGDQGQVYMALEERVHGLVPPFPVLLKRHGIPPRQIKAAIAKVEDLMDGARQTNIRKGYE